MIRELPESKGSILGFQIDNKVSLEEEKKWLSRIEEAVKEHKKISILVILSEKAGWGVRAGIEDLRWGIAHKNDIDRVAIVSDKKVWKWVAETGKIFKLEERSFTLEEIEDAWKWIGG